MKAMILAAGLGTRLRPYSLHTPKPLFTINGRPCIEKIIERLTNAGFDIIVNTHHHHDQIKTYLDNHEASRHISVRHEPEILGTGGGIRNVRDFWDKEPLLVVNADIVTDIDLEAVYRFHLGKSSPVTMVMHDCSAFNTVWVKDRTEVVSFDRNFKPDHGHKQLAFTGIHVLEPTVLAFLPQEGFADIIDAYRRMLAAGHQIDADIVSGHYWQDIGSPEGYRAAVYDHMAPAAFKKAFGDYSRSPIDQIPMHGDGSDRRWYRLNCGPKSLILSDHGIRPDSGRPQEVDAFVAIGTHLKQCGIDVPELVLYDCFAGMVFLEDLGDTHLQQAAAGLGRNDIAALYETVIDAWLPMALKGKSAFDTAWTYQSTHYDRALILEKEGRYFTEAFLRGYLGWSIPYESLEDEFNRIANGIEQTALEGFLHRDFQSRNIMIKKGRPYFIDFQGGRLGPVQYDLASLLIDPYVDLPASVRERLTVYATEKISASGAIREDAFRKGFDYCALARNLQILGAFAYLSRVKGKPGFENHIPAALRILMHNLSTFSYQPLPKLTDIVRRAAGQMSGQK